MNIYRYVCVIFFFVNFIYVFSDFVCFFLYIFGSNRDDVSRRFVMTCLLSCTFFFA